jgi:glutathione S-transferase
MSATQTGTESLPVLWQLQISHYNEKVRWALDYKRIPHLRRSLLPGLHAFQARRLTGDCDTTPVLTLDGRSIGDSTRIIAALEERWPEPPLYPEDEAERRRALELEEFFDEELGPDMRRAAYYELLTHPEMVVPLFTNGQRWPARMLVRAAFPLLRVGMRRKLEINADAAEASRSKTVAAMDRLEDEIGPSGFLVGDSFSVADLTAASLFYPVASPPEFPYPSVQEPPESGREFLESLAQRPGGEWVAEMYRRHRRPAGRPALSRATASPGEPAAPASR